MLHPTAGWNGGQYKSSLLPHLTGEAHIIRMPALFGQLDVGVWVGCLCIPMRRDRSGVKSSIIYFREADSLLRFPLPVAAGQQI